MNKPIVSEPFCTYKIEGREYTLAGAYLDDACGAVYIVKRDGHWLATDWHGNLISANVVVTSQWRVYASILGTYTMHAIRFSVANKTYYGRYNSDWSQLCQVRRTKS
jgi:hypothetical protein